jgi:cytochrome P450
MKSVDAFNFMDGATLENPYEFYQAAIAQAPVYHVPDTDIFLVTRHDLICRAARDTVTFSSKWGHKMRGDALLDPDVKAEMAKGWLHCDTLITNDPPSHTRFRSLVNAAFSRPRVQAIEATIAEAVNRAVDALLDKGEVEFINDFAAPIPLSVIAGILGCPFEMQSTFKRWSDAVMLLLGGFGSKEQNISAAQAFVEFQHYFKGLIDQRRVDASFSDLTCSLVHARVAGERPLDDRELLNVLEALLVAGNETTTAMFGHGMKLLVEHPDVLGRVKNDPALIPTMIEEVLRYSSPASGLWRVVTRDTELGGVAIPEGAMLHLRYAAANRDPEVFENPDQFDIDRPNLQKHLAFGHGSHFCIGNMLARKELVVGFGILLERVKRFEFIPGKNDFRHNPSLLARGLEELHIRVE